MVEIELVDRSSMIAALNREIRIVPSSTAIVAIDMHRGHLDMSVATMPTTPEDAERVIGNAKKLLGYARSLGVSVIHVKLVMRRLRKGGSETNNVRFWQALQKIGDDQDRLTPRRPSTRDHQAQKSSPSSSRRATISSTIRSASTALWAPTSTSCSTVSVFARYASWASTRTTCVLNTAFTAFNLNYEVVVLSDCVTSMYGEDLHVFGWQNVARCIGWVLSNEQLCAKLERPKVE
jgi:biuret amidohydrolase